MPTVPPRVPVEDALHGVVLHALDVDLLAASAPDGAAIVASGSFIVRYGLRCLGKPHLSIVPGLVVIDYGTFLNGEDAWIFLTERSNRYPRAEVFGYRSDGRDEQIYVRDLDLALTPQPLVYADIAASLPLAQPAAWIGVEEAAPARLLAYLPRYANLMDWQSAQRTT
jgi:hypothetical protein